MKRALCLAFLPLFFVILGYGCGSRSNTISIQTFFRTMGEFQCQDSISSADLRFKYHSFNQNEVSFSYFVPDTVEHADFLNAYTNRISDAYYHIINSSRESEIQSILDGYSCNADSTLKYLAEYFNADIAFKGVFDEAVKAYRGANSPYLSNVFNPKPTFSIDSLISLSLGYFGIVGFAPDGNLACHFACGEFPFELNYSNRIGFMVAGFCKEAIQNRTMSEAFTVITQQLTNRIKVEQFEPYNNKFIKGHYQPILLELLRADETLRRSLVLYYQKRKGIEPFTLVY